MEEILRESDVVPRGVEPTTSFRRSEVADGPTRTSHRLASHIIDVSGNTPAEQTRPDEPNEQGRRRWGLGNVVVGYAVALVASSALGLAWLSLVGGTQLDLVGLAVAQVGLWGGFLGAPWYASRRKGTRSLRRDFGLSMRLRDALIGIPTGLACQFGLVPLIYLPLSRFVDTDELERPVRELVDRAPGWTFFAMLRQR